MFYNDLKDPDLITRLNKVVAALGLRNESTDLVLDLQVIENHIPNLLQICSLVPYLNNWRTFTVIGGSFSKDLTNFSVGQHRHPRLEWQMWKNLVGNSKFRKPSFGDYTTQHGIYIPTPERPNFSASIRYTCNDYWVIMRGEGVFHDGSQALHNGQPMLNCYVLDLNFVEEPLVRVMHILKG